MQLPEKILTRKDEITAKFLKLMDRHFTDILNDKVDTMYHVKDFADLIHIHPTHLSNTIKLTTDKSPCDWMEERIINEAKQMLSNSAMPIASICYKLTYNDPSNFTKFFKMMEGKTPSQYRKQFIKN